MRSRKSSGDIGLSASVFKVLAQSKPYLSYIENGNRINRLHQTLIWIYEQQSEDGCYYENEQNKYNVWPLHFKNHYELTGYVLASLLEAGLDFGSKPLAKAYQCLVNNTEAIMAETNTHPLSAIFYAYIETLLGNTENSQVLIQALKPIDNLVEKDVYDREMLSYLGLIYYKTNDLISAQKIAERLTNRSKLWQTPISSYAITKLWPLLKYRTSNLKVYRENNEIASTLILNETHSHHSLVGHQISMQDKGCLFISNKQIKTSLTPESTNFEVTIDGLNKGFVSCNKRRIGLCIKQKVHYSGVHPVVRIQLITGFDVDKKLMKKMTDRQIVSKYKDLEREVMIFLHPFHNKEESHCITVPIVQRHELHEGSEAYIKIYDYYNEDLSDLIPYAIPLQCQIQ